MVPEVPAWCVLVLASLTAGAGGAEAASCERGLTWWHRERAACVPCTRCDPALRQVVKLPCDIHRDTVCHSLQHIQIFPEELNSDDYFDYDYKTSDVTDSVSDGKWDVQTSTTLTLAASGCVVFFVVVLFLSVYHAKQWKALKQALKADVKDLSAKLKLMEAGTEPRVERTAPVDHVYCNIHVGKGGLIGPTTAKKGLANVYTQQEKH